MRNITIYGHTAEADSDALIIETKRELEKSGIRWGANASMLSLVCAIKTVHGQLDGSDRLINDLFDRVDLLEKMVRKIGENPLWRVTFEEFQNDE